MSYMTNVIIAMLVIVWKPGKTTSFWRYRLEWILRNVSRLLACGTHRTGRDWDRIACRGELL